MNINRSKIASIPNLLIADVLRLPKVVLMSIVNEDKDLNYHESNKRYL